MANSARSLSDAGQYHAALSAYEAVYARWPAMRLLVQVGRMHQKLGNPQEAIRSYQIFLNSPDAALYPEFADTARRYKQEAIRDLVHSTNPRTGPHPPPPPPPEMPVYKRWWFWVAISSGLAVAAGISIGAGVAASPKTPHVPDGVSAFDITF